MVAFLAYLLCGAGCASMPVDRHFSPIAVWYRVDANMQADNQAAFTSAADDLATISDLGFNTVLLDGPAAHNHEMLDPLAERHGLLVVAPDEDAQAYVSTGRLPAECWWPWALAWHTQRRDAKIVSFGEITDRAGGQRARTLATLHHKSDAAPATFAAIAAGSDVAAEDIAVTFIASAPENGADETEKPVGNLADISVRQPIGGPDAATAGWLSAFHRALAAGQTSGVVVDRFRSASPDWDAMVDQHGAISAARASALKRITMRAAKWCPRLRGTTARRIEAAGTADLSIEIVVFTGAKRHFVMVWNASDTQFAHESVVLNVQFGDRGSRRLVVVPGDDSTAVGDVLMVHGGRATVSTDLAPGDARLYEVF